jgi:NTE family protein
MPSPNENKKRLALVIGSGSVKCAAALGVWKILSQEKIDIDMYVGCSGGSMFASLMALGKDVDESISNALQLWNKSVTEKRHWLSILRAIMPRVFGFNERFGMISDKRVLQGLERGFGDQTFADTSRPLRILATDFHDGEAVVIAEGKLVDAIRASICIPYIWQPWPLGDRLLIDGAYSNPMPVDVAIKERMDIILAVGFESPLPKSVKSISRFAFHLNSIQTNNLFKANYAFHSLAHHSEIVLILPQFNRPINLFSTDQIPYVIEQGELATKEQVPYIRRLLDEYTSK